MVKFNISHSDTSVEKVNLGLEGLIKTNQGLLETGSLGLLKSPKSANYSISGSLDSEEYSAKSSKGFEDAESVLNSKLPSGSELSGLTGLTYKVSQTYVVNEKQAEVLRGNSSFKKSSPPSMYDRKSSRFDNLF